MQFSNSQGKNPKKLIVVAQNLCNMNIGSRIRLITRQIKVSEKLKCEILQNQIAFTLERTGTVPERTYRRLASGQGQI